MGLTQQDLFFLRDAVHSHMRSEIDKLIQMSESMTTDELLKAKQLIKVQCESMKAKITELIDQTEQGNASLDLIKAAAQFEKNRGW